MTFLHLDTCYLSSLSRTHFYILHHLINNTLEGKSKHTVNTPKAINTKLAHFLYETSQKTNCDTVPPEATYFANIDKLNMKSDQVATLVS